MNCHGCKWLDDCGIRSPEIRRPEYERCELYEPGDFKTRFKED